MIDRNERGDAERIITELCPNLDARLAWARITLRSIEAAKDVAPNSCAITLFDDKVRLNVGQIAVLELWQGIVALYCCAPVSLKPSQGLRRFKWSGYRAVKVPTERWRVQSAALPRVPRHLIAKHLELVRVAATSKRTTPFRHAHSPGVMAYLESISGGSTKLDDRPLPDEVVASSFPEGGTRRITVNAYERSDAARTACIERHGTSCSICGFAFGSVYGPVAEGYIHVHHITPISNIGRSYEVNPANDLRPVCPNCHAVIHLGGETRPLEEVRRLMETAKGANTGILTPPSRKKTASSKRSSLLGRRRSSFGA